MKIIFGRFHIDKHPVPRKPNDSWLNVRMSFLYHPGGVLVKSCLHLFCQSAFAARWPGAL